MNINSVNSFFRYNKVMKKICVILLLINMQLFASYPSLLFSGNCETCHKIDKSVSAPSIILIQQRYKQAFPTKKEFVKYMSEWVYSPDEKTSIMREQIEKYEIMPYLSYDKKTLEEIAEYLYETDFHLKNN